MAYTPCLQGSTNILKHEIALCFLTTYARLSFYYERLPLFAMKSGKKKIYKKTNIPFFDNN